MASSCNTARHSSARLLTGAPAQSAPYCDIVFTVLAFCVTNCHTTARRPRTSKILVVTLVLQALRTLLQTLAPATRLDKAVDRKYLSEISLVTCKHPPSLALSTIEQEEGVKNAATLDLRRQGHAGQCQTAARCSQSGLHGLGDVSELSQSSCSGGLRNTVEAPPQMLSRRALCGLTPF